MCTLTAGHRKVRNGTIWSAPALSGDALNPGISRFTLGSSSSVFLAAPFIYLLVSRSPWERFCLIIREPHVFNSEACNTAKNINQLADLVTLSAYGFGFQELRAISLSRLLAWLDAHRASADKSLFNVRSECLKQTAEAGCRF
jgi:hypothetical protein